MVDKAHTSTDVVSDYDSSAGSTYNIKCVEKQWARCICGDILDGETDYSGTCSLVDPLKPHQENGEVMENGGHGSEATLGIVYLWDRS